ncbi:capsular polysaccharide biosynthesis protein [Psychrobacter sp. Pi2-1]|uniref:capsular polysaccharide biosynthesis protein n=1 Tax=Psychrobacter sp. Pi2-1 TaxID=2774131 RepID=UPI001919C0B5|nr:capsular polysaccharide biosynthesis protein [Psychrobacter sp. Pi2-1]
MKQPSENTLDIVIAWVDGADPVLKRKRGQYKPTKEVASDAITDTRFASDDEIYYNIASIIKYVPFCRHIYIVTDQQKPAFVDEFAKQGICSADKIRIIDHKDIFSGYEQFLPTFNSTSIETMVWNIKGLSDYFIYMNDDFFFNQPVKMDEFLDDEKIIIHGHWQKKIVLNTKMKYRQLLNKFLETPIQPKYTTAQMLGSIPLKTNQFFKIHHYPHIVDKSILSSYLLSNLTFLESQIKHRFRDISQFDPISLANHLSIQKNQAVLKPDLNLNYLKNEYSVEKFIKNLDDESIKYGCIQSMDLLSEGFSQKVNKAMIKKFYLYLPESLLREETQCAIKR